MPSYSAPPEGFVDATTVRYTLGPPTPTDGLDQAGDFAIDPVAMVLYGPFVGTGSTGVWGPG